MYGKSYGKVEAMRLYVFFKAAQ